MVKKKKISNFYIIILRGYNDIDTGVRISEAYAKTGKDMAKYLIKNIF